jgi:hypothetical protein
MIDPIKSAADDLIKVYWRHHAKWDIPNSLENKQANGNDLVQVARHACSIIEGILAETPVIHPLARLSQKAILESRRAARQRAQLRVERKDVLPRLESAMAELDGEEWYYFWGLHQILDILPQTLEEK